MPGGYDIAYGTSSRRSQFRPVRGGESIFESIRVALNTRCIVISDRKREHHFREWGPGGTEKCPPAARMVVPSRMAGDEHPAASMGAGLAIRTDVDKKCGIAGPRFLRFSVFPVRRIDETKLPDCAGFSSACKARKGAHSPAM
jgi:hypothetical protein